MRSTEIKKKIYNYIPTIKWASCLKQPSRQLKEAIVNAMVAAETMEGINGNKVYALPHQRVIDILKKYKRIKS